MPLALLTGAAIITLLTFFDLALTAATGIFVSAINRPMSALTRTVIAFFARLFLPLLVALILIMVGESRMGVDRFNATELYATGSSIADNGLRLAAAALTAPRHMVNVMTGDFYTGSFPPVVFAYLCLLYTVMIMGALLIAMALLRRRS